MRPQFTDKAQMALAYAERAARNLKQSYVGTEHILLGLLKEGTGVAATVLIEGGVEEYRLKEMIQELVAPESVVMLAERDGYSPRAEKVLDEARRQAERFHSDKIGTEHILLALLKEGENVAVRILNTMGISIQKLYVEVLAAMGEDKSLYKEDLGRKQNRKKGSVSTLEQYSRDLTALARDGKLDPVIGREDEIRRVIQILSRRTKNNYIYCC